MERRYALIMGATKGLGASLAQEALARGIAPIALGRSHADTMFDPAGLTRVRWDVTDETTWRRAFDMATRARPDFVVWNAGIYGGRKPFHSATGPEDDALIDTHLRGPIAFLRRLHRLMMETGAFADPTGAPYHLITIASTSSYRRRENEEVYCAVKAAKAAFTRQFSRSLARDLPGSKTLLVNPGGMDSGFLAPYQDVSMMMKTPVVAKIVWDRALAQEAPYDEINILRNDDGTPSLQPGIKTPESPF